MVIAWHIFLGNAWFDLGLKSKLYQRKACVGINMGQHGLINWADDDKACYEL